MSGLKRIDVVAGVLWRMGKFLACQRPAGKPLAGYWELPGGKLEPGESGAQALMRELYEELGISCRDCIYLATVEHPWPEQGLLAVIQFYEVSAFHGDPVSREGQKLCWLYPDDIKDLDFLPADRKILPLLLRGK